MNKYISTLVVAAACLVTACRTDIVYTKFATIPSNEWHVDSVVRFEVPITDASATYRTLVYVRHTERYPYQNMWLFIRNANHCDTIEFYLADDRGQWLGNSNHGFIEMPVLLDENRHFPDTGTYVIEIQHGLRDTVLRGIADVGFEVLRVE
ncbi:MAG: gliding motility lipoprotein GldH [Paludibacteraceae bacterium]|nr:gliding motility lipoprotein GldH [Paludibacteraceae bacterium]